MIGVIKVILSFWTGTVSKR